MITAPEILGANETIDLAMEWQLPQTQTIERIAEKQFTTADDIAFVTDGAIQ